MNWNILSDKALEEQIGLYIRRTRQQQNKTQEEVANAANISRSTLSLLERGESGNLKTLIQVLRVLDRLFLLKGFQYEEQLSPIALAKAQRKSRERVRRNNKSSGLSDNNNTNW